MNRKEQQTPQSQAETPVKSTEQQQGTSIGRQQGPPQQANRQRVITPGTGQPGLVQTQQTTQAGQSGGRKPHTGPNPGSQIVPAQTSANRTQASTKSQAELTVQEEVRSVLWGISDDQQGQQTQQAPVQQPRPQQRPVQQVQSNQQIQQGQQIQQSQQGQQGQQGQRPRAPPPQAKQSRAMTGSPVYSAVIDYSQQPPQPQGVPQSQQVRVASQSQQQVLQNTSQSSSNRLPESYPSVE